MPKHHPARARRWQAAIIITLFFVAVAGAAAVGWWYARESPPHQGPIVVIATDGLPAEVLPIYGGHGAETPAIDALAADSVVFDRAYAHSSEVLPAHASLVTGQLPIDHGVRDDAGFVLKSDVRTLAEVLRSRGFNTGAAVASVFLRRDSGVAQGFTFFAAGPTSVPADYGATSPVDTAERWARTQANQRYFLLLQVSDTEADTAVSRICDLLKERQLYDRATIVLIGERGRSVAGGSLDDSTLRVPFVIKQPAGEAAGRRISAPVQQIDVVPTILDFVRAPLPGGLRGRSLRGAIDDGAPLPAQPIYSESLAGYYRFGATPLFALTTDTFRYLRAGDEQVVALPGVESADEPPVERLRAALDRVSAKKPLDAPSPINAADEEILALAGYLQGLPPVPPGDPALDAAEQEKIAEAHQAAAVLAGQRMFSAAIDALRAIVRAHPSLASVQYQVGVLLARSGRVEEAVAPLQTAADLRPDAVDIPLTLVDVLMRAGRYQDAHEQIDRALAGSAQPDAHLGDVHAAAARLALAEKDRDAAVMHADAARAANPGLPMPQFVRGRLAFDEAQFDTALAAFREAVAVTRERGTTLPDLHFYVGECLAHLEQYSEAETEFREELAAFPHNIHAYASLAMLYRAAGRDVDVEDVVNELVEAAPTPEGYALAARLWTVLGDRSRAEALRSDARARFRGDPSLALLGRDARR